MLINLGFSLGQRCLCASDLADINNASHYLLLADSVTRDGSPFKPVILENLGKFWATAILC